MRLGNIELVFNLAHQLLEHIFHGHHAGGRSEFIHHTARCRLRCLNSTSRSGKRLGLRHDQHFAHDVAHLQIRMRDVTACFPGVRVKRDSASSASGPWHTARR